MLAGLDARQLSEMYAFARAEPLDEPLQRMLAELTATLARVHGNEMNAGDFMLVREPVEPVDDKKLRQQQIVELFAKASRRNEKAK